MRPILAQKGDSLPVSAFEPDGIFPVATSQYEKRGVAINVPEWIARRTASSATSAPLSARTRHHPGAADRGRAAEAPGDFETLDAVGKELKGTSSASRSHPGLHGLRQLRRHLPGQDHRPWS
jgi:pyruvate-ferredoxin/flavodoxin oxidoreductase